MPEKWQLRQKQAMPLEAKIVMSIQRIREWYDHFDGNVCVSFSGGKDSTVLAHLVHSVYPDVPLVFSNTGLEYPEIQAFARKMGADFVRPKMSFAEVISNYGYPIISKEVSEAIHYARRIVVPEGGGMAQRDRHQTGRDGWTRTARLPADQGVHPGESQTTGAASRRCESGKPCGEQSHGGVERRFSNQTNGVLRMVSGGPGVNLPDAPGRPTAYRTILHGQYPCRGGVQRQSAADASCTTFHGKPPHVMGGGWS